MFDMVSVLGIPSILSLIATLTSSLRFSSCGIVFRYCIYLNIKLFARPILVGILGLLINP